MLFVAIGIAGSGAGGERFYRQNALRPGRWLRVIVDFNDVPAWIVTVLVQDNDPRLRQQ